MTNNELLLLAMILAPQELCIEKARYMFNHHIPLAHKGHISLDWITDEVKDDILHMQKAGIKQSEIARWYCIPHYRLAFLFPTYRMPRGNSKC